MNSTSLLTLLVILFFVAPRCFSQKRIPYKQIDTTQLFMELYEPEKIDTTLRYPAMVFFFGGGWRTGDVTQFKKHASYFSKRGMVIFLVDYRVEKKHQSTPFESLKDTKSAIRHIRKNAKAYHIDASRIVAAGGSAGGQLAAATALTESFNESSDDKTVSCKPNALILFNPVIDNGPGGYGYARIGDAYKDFSPLHTIKSGAPPTLLLLGTDDHLVPVETAKYYQTVMRKVKSRCDLILYDGAGHGFFNYNHFEYYTQTVAAGDQFLQSLGYLTKEPFVKIE